MKKVFLVLLLLVIAMFILINIREDLTGLREIPEKVSMAHDFSIDRVFIITIDTLRADHLGCYGYPRNTSDFIDSMAAKGILFEKAYCQSASTAPSHASIFTGLYPSQHRVMANGYRLRDSYTTLAEILDENGFSTIAFTSTDRHFYRSNIDQGFNHYEEPIDTVKMYGYKYRPAAMTIDTVIEFLSNKSVENKLFLWVHLFDPHLPYHPPEECYEKIEKDIPRLSFMKYLETLHIDPEVFNQENIRDGYETLNNSEKMYDFITHYDAEVMYVDRELKRLYEFINSEGLNDNSIWIITGDHGEGLGQHNWLGHSAMIYQEEIHVPLIFVSTANFAAQRIKAAVGNFNIFSTVLDLLNIRLSADLQSEIQSVSLAQSLYGNKSFLPSEFVFTEREKRFEDGALINLYDEKEKYAVQMLGYKYYYRSNFQDELYDLIQDPQEQNNIIGSLQHLKIRFNSNKVG